MGGWSNVCVWVPTNQTRRARRTTRVRQPATAAARRWPGLAGRTWSSKLRSQRFRVKSVSRVGASRRVAWRDRWSRPGRDAHLLVAALHTELREQADVELAEPLRGVAGLLLRRALTLPGPGGRIARIAARPDGAGAVHVARAAGELHRVDVGPQDHAVAVHDDAVHPALRSAPPAPRVASADDRVRAHQRERHDSRREYQPKTPQRRHEYPHYPLI